MKKTATFLILMAVTSIATWSQEAAKKAERTKPIAALGWLVGGVWTADGSKLAPGLQRIETRYQWSDNNAYIRFTTHFVLEKGAVHSYDGNFFWNPESAALAMWYMDAGNSITQGPMKFEGDTLQITWHGPDFEGKPADLRVMVTRKTNDHYHWRVEEKQPEGWKQLATLDYLRVAGS